MNPDANPNPNPNRRSYEHCGGNTVCTGSTLVKKAKIDPDAANNLRPLVITNGWTDMHSGYSGLHYASVPNPNRGLSPTIILTPAPTPNVTFMCCATGVLCMVGGHGQIDNMLVMNRPTIAILPESCRPSCCQDFFTGTARVEICPDGQLKLSSTYCFENPGKP